jgi:hypothetical protein
VARDGKSRRKDERRGPLQAGLIGLGGLFSNPTAAIRALPLAVVHSLPSRSATYPSLVSRSSCSNGMLAAQMSPTLSSEANSSRVSVFGSEATTQE